MDISADRLRLIQMLLKYRI